MMTLLARLLRFSVDHRYLVLVVTLCVGALGTFNLTRLPIDAVPDITNVQVQINTPVQALAPIEVERRITYPIEAAMGGLPKVEQVRSLSRYGLSQVTVVFEDGTDIYWARQLVAERLASAKEALPPGAEPALGPIATGLGEIFMWVLEADPDARKPDGTPYDITDLRTLQDWVVRPQLRNIPGVTEVNTIGGFERLYQVAPDPARLTAYGLSFKDVFEALRRNNGTAGGGYIEQKDEQLLVRVTGVVENEADLAAIVVRERNGVPVRIADVADIVIGRDLRTGAATENGKEVVIGTAIMLVGENSREISTRVRERLEEVQKSLPDGVKVKTLYDRTYLVDATIHTVAKSLAEGAVLVIVVLFFLLGNLRAALIAALAIPFSMLITISGMVEGKVSGNLMSLGAIDFGLIVDGSVIVVENSIRRFAREQEQLGRVLRLDERLSIAYAASREVLQASVFGSIVIAVVYLPILSLTGIEGKMFRPMALTVVIALTGATVLSMTFIPALVSVALGGRIQEKENVVFRVARGAYERTLRAALAQRPLVVTLALGLVGVASAFALGLGSEFAPKLGEGALAVQSSRIPSISISASVEMQMTLERVLKEKFPDEIDRVFARTGTAEVATDPMGPNVSDTYIMLTPREQWTKASTQAELAEEMEKALRDLPGQSFELSQPIELRFNELISGVRSDVAVKVFGDDLETMKAKAAQISDVLSRVEGAADVKVEQTSGLPVLTMQIDRAAVGRYGLAVEDVQDIVSAAVGGAEAGQVYDGDRRFDLVVRMPESLRRDVRALENLPIPLPEHGAEEGADERFVPLGALAHVSIEEGPNQVSREDGKRRVVVQCNVRGRDLGGFVAEAQRKIDAEVERTPGVWLTWGGQFENLIEARERLAVVVPVALFLILALLYAAFGSAKNALLIFSGVPLALTGGVAALFIRGLPFSISAAVGFIALSGVAVLNGLVMVSFIESLRQSGVPLDRALFEGSIARLRPVLMTALVAALGFIPMALATGTGAEVQRPLATVVVGGIISSTLLTLVVLPVLYRIFNRGGTAVVDAQRPPEEATVSASGAE